MTKTNMVPGWLCRNSQKWGGNIIFVFLQKPIFYDGLVGRCVCRRVWSYGDWQATYNLKPPAYGKCFEVSIEL